MAMRLKACADALKYLWHSFPQTAGAEGSELMRPLTRIILVTSLLSIGFGLGACADFDPEKSVESLDVFGWTKKKPLPGERKDVFPGGVPGVSQGVPPELTKGYQPAEQQVDPAEAAAAK